MDESELIEIVTKKITDKARSYAGQYEQAADDVPFDLNIEGVVESLRALADDPLEAAVDPDKLEEAIEAIREHVEAEFESMGAQPESGLLPADYMVVRPATNAKTAREALENGGLTTREDLEDRAEQAINEAGVGPKKYSFACAETVYQGDYDEPRIVVDVFEQIPIDETYRIINETYYEDGEDFESDVLEAPTWRELAPVVNRMVKTTASGVDCFLEGIVLTGDEQDGTPVARLSCGS